MPRNRFGRVVALLTGSISQTTARPKMGGAYVLTAILGAVAFGLLVLAQSIHERDGRVSPAVIMLYGVGLGVAALTMVYHRWAKKAVAQSQEEEARRAQFPDQPWKWPKEWQGPYLESDSGKSAAGLWFFAIVWNAFSAPLVWLFFHEVNRKPGMLVIFLFPLVGIGVLWAALYQTVRQRKYGRTRFVPSSLPGVIGGYLGGVIEVPAPVLPEGEGRLVLKCIRREVRGSGKNRSTTENVLWEHEELIARDKWISGVGGTRIPVLFYIPAGRAATDASDRNNEIFWRLAASAATAGVDFATQFKVPVYVTGATAAPPAAGAPVLEEYSAPVLDAATLKSCGVRREGDTFHFSASHLPGTKATTAVLQLGIFALLGWYMGRDIPGVVWGITIFFGLLMSLFTAGVWCATYELRIDGGDVVVTKPRPWGTKVARVPRAEVLAVKSDKAMSSGENQYFSLSLVGAEGIEPGVTAMSGEPFRGRKLRYQLEQLQQQGGLTPEKVKEMGGALIAEMKASPKFVLPFAALIPGQTKAEAIGALVLAVIRGKV